MKTTVEEVTWNWHKRFRHLNFQCLMLLHDKELVYGLAEIKESHNVCESCSKGKQYRESFDKNQAWRAKLPLELIHSDVCGLVHVSSIRGSKYLLTFIDDCTRCC